MKKYNTYRLVVLLIVFSITAYAQSNNNGQIDQISELSKKFVIQSMMQDGIKISSDVYLPYTLDDLNVTVGTSTLNILPKGSQWLAYPSKPDKYKIPLMSTRTVYNPLGEEGFKTVFNLLGYGFVVNSPRGQYLSEGIHHPYFNDGWKKGVYHPTFSFDDDLVPISDPRNSNNQEDSWDFNQDVINNFTENRFLNNASTRSIHNGVLGVWGGSNLAINQFFWMASKKVNPIGAGLKSAVPLVGTDDVYRTSIQQHGMFRQGLVKNWIGYVYLDVTDGNDGNIHNATHTTGDYGQANKAQLVQYMMDRVTTEKHNGTHTYMYPNSGVLNDLSVGDAPVDASGNSSATGTVSRYTNMEVPTYNLTGWYDIFGDGQIKAWKGMKNNLTTHANKQKIIIGPWGHTTLGGRKVGDITYPANVLDAIGFDFNLINMAYSIGDIDLYPIINSEIFRWFYSTMNNNNHDNVGEPHFFIPASTTYQNIVYNGVPAQVKIPSSDYSVPMHRFINYLGKKQLLPAIPVDIKMGFFELNIPITPNELTTPSLKLSQALTPYQTLDVATIPPIRMYVIGNVGDGINPDRGYWLAANDFPIPQTTYQDVFLHGNGKLSITAPTTDEGTQSFAHDPDNPIRTVGGHNFTLKNPDNTSDAMGQIDLRRFASTTLTPGKVTTYETAVLKDSVSFVGYPKMTLYASSSPRGAAAGSPTDADFVVRLVDVYPDGREYFITEGSVNARARAYVKSLHDNVEDINAAYTNINSGQVYEYKFDFLPIAYTLAKGHKLKMVVSGASYPRYQSCANVPIEDGDFFRREPGDGKTYSYQGTTYAPRISDNSVHISTVHKTKLSLPILGMSHIAPSSMIDIELATVGTTTMTNTISENGWTYYEDPSRPSKYLFAIEHKPIVAGGNTNNVTMSVVLNKQVAHESSENVTSADATYGLSRHWNVDVQSGTLNGSINLRFYYDPSEVATMIAAATAFKNTNNGMHQSDAMWVYSKDNIYTTSTHLRPKGLNIPIQSSTQPVSFGTQDNVAYVQYNGVTFANRAGGSGVASIYTRRGEPAPQPGTIRFNSETKTLEGWDGNNWVNFH